MHSNDYYPKVYTLNFVDQNYCLIVNSKKQQVLMLLFRKNWSVEAT